MNKHLHRTVFNAARGMRMVVQETARSAGKATGATSAMLATALLTALQRTSKHYEVAMSLVLNYIQSLPPEQQARVLLPR